MKTGWFTRREVSKQPKRRLRNLQRFAPQAGDNGSLEMPTTICGDILHAAHNEVERISRPTAVRPDLEAMLGIVSYCYTKGLFSSADIERELWQVPAFLTTFGDRLPTAHQIRSFRRRHRPLILSVIEHAIIEFSHREPLAVQQQVLPPETALTEPAQVIAQWLLDMANYSDSLEEDAS